MRLSRIAIGAAMLTAFVGVASAIAVPPTRPSREVTIGDVAKQLGVRVAYGADHEFTLGSSFTSSLEDPSKLAAFGIERMRVGARVVAARVAHDRIVVEADQLDPPLRASARLVLDPAGRLSTPPKT